MRILLTIPLAVLVAGCGSEKSTTDTTGSAPAATTGARKAQTVVIEDFKFGPAVTIAAGGKVTWRNTDGAPHNAAGDGFKTKDLEKGDSDTLTFAKAGTFDYVCQFHPYMKGTVVVR